MKNRILLIVPFLIFLAGCATNGQEAETHLKIDHYPKGIHVIWGAENGKLFDDISSLGEEKVGVDYISNPLLDEFNVIIGYMMMGKGNFYFRFKKEHLNFSVSVGQHSSSGEN